ncbi:DUF2975 domain-containing protein [Alcaligenes sp. SDU_A2]|uniref:DUF2975 domain-containing protein n=1 Tax=Alcaligenes sp. SDU_A2 TaxID=3136634 RepID=UPI00311D9ACE
MAFWNLHMPCPSPPPEWPPTACLTGSSQQTITHVATWARWFFLLISILLGMGSIGLWLPSSEFLPDLTTYLDLPAEQAHWLNTSPLYRLVGFVITLVPALLLIRSINHARHMLDSFRHGHVLTLLNAMRLRSIASLVTGFGITFPLSKTLTALALTATNPPERQIHIIILNLSDIMLLSLGMFMWVLSWVMVEAARVGEENSRFV